MLRALGCGFAISASTLAAEVGVSGQLSDTNADVNENLDLSATVAAADDVEEPMWHNVARRLGRGGKGPTPRPTPIPPSPVTTTKPCKKGHRTPHPTPAPLCTADQQTKVKWSLCDAQDDPIDFYSNLAGRGPHSGSAQEFRMKKITVVNGVTLDLVVTVAPGENYTSTSQINAGYKGKDYGGAYVSPCPAATCTKRPEPQRTGLCWGEIPVHVHTRTKFIWKWVKTGTSEAYTVERFEVEFVELDHQQEDWDGLGPDAEFIEFNTHVDTIRHGTAVTQETMTCGRYRIKSKEVGNAQDNPSKMGKMTKANKERSVTVSYKNKKEWYITLGHEGPKQQRWDRIISFTGTVHTCPTPAPTPNSCQKPQKVQWRMCNDNNGPIDYSSNLAGQGPDTTADAEFRMKEIAEVGGTMLDLVVSVPDGESYTSFIQTKNKGPGGAYVSPCPTNKCKGNKKEPQDTGNCWGVLPWKYQTATKFHWKWVETGTNNVFDKIDKFEIRFYELDRERDRWGNGKEDNEYIEFDTPLSKDVVFGSKIRQKIASDGKTIRVQSMEQGNAKDNLVRQGKMTATQKKRQVKATYAGIGEWDITIGHEGGNAKNSDRAVEFTGAIFTCP